MDIMWKISYLKVWNNNRPCFTFICLNLGSIWAGGSGIKKKTHPWGWCESLLDPLASFDCSPDWSVANIISNILCVKESFLSCLFCWVKGECNLVAHVAAKFSLRLFRSFCFNKLSLPKVLRTTCEVDCSSFFPVWIKLKIMKEKKKRRKRNPSMLYFVANLYNSDGNTIRLQQMILARNW